MEEKQTTQFRGRIAKIKINIEAKFKTKELKISGSANCG